MTGASANNIIVRLNAAIYMLKDTNRFFEKADVHVAKHIGELTGMALACLVEAKARCQKVLDE
jgi:hypothetical protein